MAMSLPTHRISPGAQGSVPSSLATLGTLEYGLDCVPKLTCRALVPSLADFDKIWRQR
jgi:hypothetical protein